jgi:integrase
MLGKLFTVARDRKEYAFIVVKAATGLRRGEMRGLNWSSVNLEKKQIFVHQSLSETRMYGLRLKSTKSDRSRRYVDLDDFALEVLAGHRRKQEEE